MARNRKFRDLNQPLRLNDHGRPRTRREFLGQGLSAGLGLVTGPTLFGFPALGLTGFLTAAVLGIWLVIGIMRSGRL